MYYFFFKYSSQIQYIILSATTAVLDVIQIFKDLQYVRLQYPVRAPQNGYVVPSVIGRTCPHGTPFSTIFLLTSSHLLVGVLKV